MACFFYNGCENGFMNGISQITSATYIDFLLYMDCSILILNAVTTFPYILIHIGDNVNIRR